MKKGTIKNNVPPAITKENGNAVLEPEVEEIPLEQVIDTTLVKHNVTETVIASLKERYSGMQLKSLDDKEGYLDIKEARKEVRKVGILTEKICEHGRDDAIKIQRLWLAKQKEILGKIDEVQKPLDAEIEKFDNEVERKEKEEIKRQAQQFIKRYSALSRLGADYDNGSFVLNHISYEIDLIKQSDEDVWNEMILPKYQKEFEAKEQERVAEENKRKEEQETLRKQQEELLRQQNELREAQQKLKIQQDEANRQQRLEQERKDAEERKAKQQIADARINQLRALGLQYNHIFNAYSFEDMNIDVVTQVDILNDEKWNELIEQITPSISERKEANAKRLVLQQEQQKQAAIKKALEDEEKRKEEEKAKRLQELDVASDKVKYEDVVKYLKATPVHLMKSPTYRGKMNAINIFISEL